MQREGFVKSNGQNFGTHLASEKRGGIGLKEAVGERTVPLSCGCLSGHAGNRQMIRLKKIREFFDSDSCLTHNRTKGSFCNLVMIRDGDAAERGAHLSKHNVAAALMIELVSNL